MDRQDTTMLITLARPVDPNSQNQVGVPKP
jgi:hypothetical protein